jgi:hypothetical protein
MGRQEDACWRCGAQWAFEDVPSTTLRAIAGGRRAGPVAELARAAAGADQHRWMNEDDSAGAVPEGPLRAVAAMR